MKTNSKSLVIWPDASYNPETFLSIVAAADSDVAVRLLADRFQAEAYLKDAAEPRLFLFYMPPIPALCQLLAEGTAPAAALQIWRERALDQLKVLRRHRGKVTAISTAQMAAYPKAFWDIIGVAAEVQDVVAIEAVDPVFELLALTALSQDVVAKNLCDELSVSSVDLSSGKERRRLELDVVFEKYQNLVSEAEKHAAIDQKAVSDELDRLHETINVQQESINRLNEKILSLQEVVDTQEVEKNTFLESDKADKAKKQEAYNSLLIENDILHRQLAHMQEEVNRYYAELSSQVKKNHIQREEYDKRIFQLNQGIESFQSQIKDAAEGKNILLGQIQSLHDIHVELEAYYHVAQELEEDISRIRNSWSYRMTAPLRWFRKASDRKAQ